MQTIRGGTAASRSILFSVSYLALGVCIAQAQQAPSEVRPGATALPPVSVEANKKKPRRAAAPSRERAPAVAQQPAAKPADTHDARTGTVGYYANSTPVATKSNTPLINIPQSIDVITKDFIKDGAYQNITDITRYVPGIAVHQGEGNRDELVIRGVDSSANFFVNGFRDDVQYFRDLYNTQSIEVLKGPSALTFGRGSGGGLINRTLKEADGERIAETTVQSGSWGDRRVSLDAGQAVNKDVAVRFNAFYEGSDTFRDFGRLERYGINPTMTLTPNDTTKIKLSYEYYHDRETADRGNPSFGVGTLGNPAGPFVPNGNYSAFFGSPTLNYTFADVQTTMAVIEHDFENGLTIKNSAIYADYNRAYQNVYPGGNVDPTTNLFPYAGYQHVTNRENAINQTDFTYKTFTGPVFHTISFGTEFGRQTGIDLRNTATLTQAMGNAYDPTYFGGVLFTHLATDSNSTYRLYTESAYARDQIEVTRWLQLLGGARFDRFDMSAVNGNVGMQLSRVDDKVSPHAAIILKPVDNLSIYGSYSISYLPSAGDQFSSLNIGTVLIAPQEFENTEVGVKWNINPRLQYTAAVYQLNRTNVPLAIGGGLYALSGSNIIKGFETALNGYVTNEWQAVLGYAYTDARLGSDTNSSTAAVPPPPTFLKGNRVQLVPYNQLSLWNKYQFNPTWGAALGAIYFSDSYAASDDLVKLPGFVRFDGGVYYKYDATWSGQLTVQNIFNKGYWASADGNNNISPGQSRTVRVSATAKF
jgi:catecholate siderophore receptor